MRSLLFVPGDSRRKLDKGLGSGADVLLIDLEDSVSADSKAEARRITAAFLADTIDAPDRPRLFVRINAFETELVDADLEAVMPARPEGVMLPKAAGGPDVTRLDAKLAVREAEVGLPDGSTRILVVATETAGALFQLGSYRDSSSRLAGLAWGGEDLSAELGAASMRDPDGNLTDPFRMARSLCLAGAVHAGVAPIDTVHTNFRDIDGLKRESEMAARDGFTAKMAIHPAQVPVINAAFTPGADAIASARRIVDAFAAKPGAGVVGLDGEMVDRPHLRRAERLLERARAAGLSV
ncbi:HpcH/HpaI aldolase/citrate lyase family protein [Amorphus orientalis]|uniref:Citrate lyase subunit beta/citryl-CoA lyase n=1 Tax=Amorphus orientalis TaxID=649198 RepID=A0AAE3VPL3_9HYPH|nr:CoA ester lyase [Amorphus orientalis]MDQ0315811.1 citrate lyase subunit beta/citryl-CoA lyase [Amorphus orientalis]